jgi:uncharacterized glyoxalase superfamily protein PhnB
MQLNSYLTFDGQCADAFKFYEECLGGKIVGMWTHAGTPVESHVPSEWRNKIMHALRWTWAVICCKDLTLRPIIIRNPRASPLS